VNILVALLMCPVGIAPADCTLASAEDVQYFEAKWSECFGIAGQSVIAARAGDRTAGMMAKIVCNARRERHDIR
jgi:hypothetical protein